MRSRPKPWGASKKVVSNLFEIKQKIPRSMNLVFSIIKKKPQVCIGEISTLSFDPDKNNQSVSMSLQNHLGLRRGTRCGAVSCISWIQSGASDAWTAAAARKRCLLGVSHAGTNKHNTILYSLCSAFPCWWYSVSPGVRQRHSAVTVWRHTSHIAAWQVMIPWWICDTGTGAQ